MYHTQYRHHPGPFLQGNYYVRGKTFLSFIFPPQLPPAHIRSTFSLAFRCQALVCSTLLRACLSSRHGCPASPGGYSQGYKKP